MGEDDTPALLPLPEVLDGASARALQAALLTLRGMPLSLAAGEVSRAGSLALQVIIAAAAQWQADGQAFLVSGPSHAFAEAVRTLGITPDQLPMEPIAP